MKIYIFMNMKTEEKRRIIMLSEAEMAKESKLWTPDQWAMYLTGGDMIGDAELDTYIENEIINKVCVANECKI